VPPVLRVGGEPWTHPKGGGDSLWQSHPMPGRAVPQHASLGGRKGRQGWVKGAVRATLGVHAHLQPRVVRGPGGRGGARKEGGGGREGGFHG